MKLLIQEDLVLLLESENGSTEEDYVASQENLDWCKAQMKHLGVVSRWERIYNNYLLIIPAQKITTDEFAMNEFFYEWLIMFEYSINYAGLGSTGCDFALEIWNAKTKL